MVCIFGMLGNQECAIFIRCKDVKNIPRQSDCFSCAFFTCRFAYMHAMNGLVPMFSDIITIEDISTGIMISLIDRKICTSLLYVFFFILFYVNVKVSKDFHLSAS